MVGDFYMKMVVDEEVKVLGRRLDPSGPRQRRRIVELLLLTKYTAQRG